MDGAVPRQHRDVRAHGQVERVELVLPYHQVPVFGTRKAVSIHKTVEFGTHKMVSAHKTVDFGTHKTVELGTHKRIGARFWPGSPGARSGRAGRIRLALPPGACFRKTVSTYKTVKFGTHKTVSTHKTVKFGAHEIVSTYETVDFGTRKTDGTRFWPGCLGARSGRGGRTRLPLPPGTCFRVLGFDLHTGIE